MRDWLLIVLWAVAALLIGVGLIVLASIYPKFIALYEELGVREFPLPTLVAMKASHWLTGKWWLGVLCAIAGWAALSVLRRTPTGRVWWARLAQHNRQAKVALAAAAVVVGLVTMPLIVASLFLPMLAIRAQMAGP